MKDPMYPTTKKAVIVEVEAPGPFVAKVEVQYWGNATREDCQQAVATVAGEAIGQLNATLFP